MNIERIISVFRKSDENLVQEINVDSIKIEQLQTIFKPKEDDQQMYFVYRITETEARELGKYLDMVFDFEKYSYQLDCFSA